MSEVEVDFGKLKELCHASQNQHAATAFALDWAEKADNHIAKLQADNAFLVSERDEVAHQVCVMEELVDAAKDMTEFVDCYDNYGDLTEPNDRLKKAIKEVAEHG